MACVAREREPLTDEERREVRAFVMRLWEVSGYDEWEDFIRAAGIKQTTAHAWRWRVTKPPVPSGELLYRMLKASGVLADLLAPADRAAGAEAISASVAELEAATPGRLREADQSPRPARKRASG